MGDWRTVNIAGWMDPAEARRLREDLTYDYHHEVEPMVPCLGWQDGGLVGPFSLGPWVEESGRIWGQGNLAERDYTVEDVRAGFAAIAAKYPSFTAVAHCGGEYEAPACEASVVAVDGQAWVVAPLVADVVGVSEAIKRQRFMRALGYPSNVRIERKERD